jgi:exonuclease III
MLADPSRVRVGTWNVGSLTGKLREVVDTMIRQRVNILCVQEMK